MTYYTKYEKLCFKEGYIWQCNFRRESSSAWSRSAKRGRSVIPKGARDLFSIQPGDNLLLLADEEKGIALVPSESLDTPASLFALGREVSRDDDSKG